MDIKKGFSRLMLAVLFLVSSIASASAGVSGPASPAREKTASTAYADIAASIAVTQIIALQSGKQIKVYTSLASSSGTGVFNGYFVQGTGTNCATSQVRLSGSMDMSGRTTVMTTSVLPIMTLSASNALCWSNLTASTGSVHVVYIAE